MQAENRIWTEWRPEARPRGHDAWSGNTSSDGPWGVRACGQTNLFLNFRLANCRTSQDENKTLDTRSVHLPSPTSKGEAASSSQNHELWCGHLRGAASDATRPPPRAGVQASPTISWATHRGLSQQFMMALALQSKTFSFGNFTIQ